MAGRAGYGGKGAGNGGKWQETAGNGGKVRETAGSGGKRRLLAWGDVFKSRWAGWGYSNLADDKRSCD